MICYLKYSDLCSNLFHIASFRNQIWNESDQYEIFPINFFNLQDLNPYRLTFPFIYCGGNCSWCWWCLVNSCRTCSFGHLKIVFVYCDIVKTTSMEIDFKRWLSTTDNTVDAFYGREKQFYWCRERGRTSSALAAKNKYVKGRFRTSNRIRSNGCETLVVILVVDREI